MKNKLIPTAIALLLIGGSVSGQSFNLLKDIWPGSTGSEIWYSQAVGNTLYFPAATSGAGIELWKTDGTSAGTVMVKDINPGSDGSHINTFVIYNGTLYFGAVTAGGRQLWKTDGTAAGTVSVADICPACNDDIVSLGLVYNGKLYFMGRTAATGYEIWSYDGTSAQKLVELQPGTESGIQSFLGVLDDYLYFAGNDGVNGYAIWRTDGTLAGTEMVKVISNGVNPGIDPMGIFNGLIYFVAHDGVTGYDLWRSDGTEAGTFVIDINPGINSSYPRNFVELNGTVFFLADVSGNVEIYKTDGTIAGTGTLLPPPTGTGNRSYSDMVKMGNSLYFFAIEPGSGVGRELYKSDGTAAGTVLVKDINPGSGDGAVASITVVGNTLYFDANDGVNGDETWQSDGTTSGTTLMQDFEPGAGASDLYFVDHTDNKVFLSVETSTYGLELWVSDFTITLPLTLLEFEGAVSGKDAKLWWKTTDEHNISHIVLERSHNGTHFNPVATLQPNNTPGEHVYNYTDHPDPLTHDRAFYYRLKTVDLDGSYKYSGIVRLNWSGEDRLLVYPNPLTENANIHVTSGKPIIQWSISDVRGVTVKTGMAGEAQQLTITAANLNPGMYYLQLQTINGGRVVKPLLVQ